MKTMPSALLCLLLLIATILAIPGYGQNIPHNSGYNWPCWRGQNGDGISKETMWNPRALAGGLKIAWTADIGTGYSNIVIHSDRVYAMGNTGKYGEKLTFSCLAAGTGKMMWRRYYDAEFLDPMSTPTTDGERIYGLAADGKLRCLWAANGKQLWEKDLRGDFDARSTTHGWATSPVIEGDLLLLNANTAAIALDKKTGKLKWSVADKVPPGSWGSYATAMVVDLQGMRCAVFLGPSTLSAVEVETGRKLWSYLHKDRQHAISDPLAFDNQVFFQLIDSCALLQSDEVEPHVLWNTASLCNASMPTPVLVDGYLYGSHWPREYYVMDKDWTTLRRLDLPFRCVKWKTGEVMWEQSMKDVSLTAANGKLLMLEVTGTLHIAEASPSSYQELSSADVLMGASRPRIFAVPPVLCNGRIYCRNYAGDLICIDMSK